MECVGSSECGRQCDLRRERRSLRGKEKRVAAVLLRRLPGLERREGGEGVRVGRKERCGGALKSCGWT